MRVVIASRIFSPEPSAASFVLEAIARAFSDAGHEVVVLTVRPPRASLLSDIPGVTVRRAPVLRDSTGYVRGYVPYMSFDIPLFLRMLFSRRADLYFVEPPPTTGVVVRVATSLLRRPYVYDAADVWSDAAAMATSSSLVLRVLRAMEVWAWRGASHILTISEGVKNRMVELGSPTETTVTGFGVDATSFGFQEVPVANSPYFVYAGTFSEWHGAEVFVRAFATFAVAHPTYRLIFVGNGSERENLSRLAHELGVGGTVEFRDPVDPASLSVVLSSAVASLASLKPGQGYDYAFTTKLYASIAAGCPVVFSGVGPTGAFIREHSVHKPLGVAVDYDPGAVAAQLERFAVNPLARDARKDLSGWARDQFSLAALSRQVVSLGEKVAVHHAARRKKRRR